MLQGKRACPDEELYLLICKCGTPVLEGQQDVSGMSLCLDLQVTPAYIQDQWPTIDWYKYLCLWERLPPGMKHVADTLGISESFLARAIQGRLPERTAAQKETLRVHKRFFTALALHDLVHEVPILEVGRRYGATKGLLQSLQSAAGTFAGMVTVFCNRLGWKNLELLLSQFQSRLMFGVERELCDLVRISLLNGFRARVLYNAGFHTLAALATANPTTVETCLRNAVPFRSRRLVSGEEEIEPRSSTTTWCAKQKRGMSDSEAANVIVHEAQVILSEELNVPVSAWSGVKPPEPTSIAAAAAAADKEKIAGVLVSNGDRTSVPAIAGVRGHRKSPNTGTDPEAVKRPHLTSSGELHELPKQDNLHTEQGAKDLCGPTGGHLNGCPGFIPASTLLHKDTMTVSHTSRHQQETKSDNLTVPPLLPSTVSTIPADCSEAFPQPESSLPGSPMHNPCHDHAPIDCPRVSTEDNLQPVSPQNSPGIPCTIPDSLPSSINMSMNFSCQTFAMIDAACNAGDTSDGDVTAPHTVCEGEIQPIVVAATNTNAVGFVADSPLAISKPTVQLQVAPSVIPASDTDKDCTKQTAGAPAMTTNEHGTEVSNLHQTPTIAFTRNQTPCRKPVPLEVSLSQPSLKELSSLCSSQLSQSGVTIIDVTANETLFETFVTECLEQKCVSFSVATSIVDQGNGIGSTIVKASIAAGILLPHQNKQVVGVAFCWGEMDVYYLSLTHSCNGGEEEPTSIPVDVRAKAVREILKESSFRDKLIAYNIKQHVKFLALSCGVLPSGKSLDPKVASWMLDPDAKEKTIHRMVLQYLPDQPMLSEEDDCEEMPLSSLATHASNPQMCASAESILSFLLMSKLETLLEAEGLYKPFIDVEMPSLLALTKMELNGIGFSAEECNLQKETLQARLTELEREAYTLARRSFSLTSPEDVAQVLFIELQLPSGTSEGKQKTLGPNSRRSKKRLQHLSTAKDVLEKIRSLHPLPGIVLEWRRISSTLTKMVFPLFKEAVPHNCTQSFRIHPTCQIHTATGRVAVSDPNLQMVPKEYDIGPRMGIPKFTLGSAALTTTGDGLLSESQCLEVCQSSGRNSNHHPHSSEAHSTPSSVCMRNVFTPFPGSVFLAADYSQLELRILAHMSGDEKLRRFLNGEGDVFKMIAGEWLGVSPSSVTDKQRQETKQVCYGMIYGIGAKALGEQLGIAEEDASQFVETFRSKYRTMKTFITKTVQGCRENGYVRTLLGRKRFLPNIHSSNIHARSQAERQAVNTTIQGSAADLAKTAMVNIDRKLAEKFPNSALHLSHPNVCHEELSSAYLVLQLHDELLYEVAETNLKDVAEIVQQEMENALELSVKFPVKMKVGCSWGKLENYSV